MSLNRWRSFISGMVVIGVAFLLSQDTLARLAWQQYRRPDIALAFVSRDANLAMQLGNYYFNGGAYDLERAETAYEKAIRAASSTPPLLAHYQLARIYFIEGDFARALEEIGKELTHHPLNLRSLYVRGLIYGYRNAPGDEEQAAEDFRRFIQWAPSEWAGYNDLAWILLKQKKYAESRDILRAAIEKVPHAETNPWLWNALGVSELNLHSYGAAAAAFRRAAALAEELTEADWRRSYPGNDPATAEAGLTAFRAAIQENLRRANARAR